MKHLRILGLALLALFAFAALAAASASAEGGPEGGTPGFNKCVKAAKVGKAYTGKYTDKECKTTSPENTGKYEVESVTSGKFEAKSKTSVLTTHTTKGVPVVITCKKDKAKGEIIFENEVVEENVTFEDCTANGVKTDTCGNVGPETIETEPQEGELVWLNSGRTEAGILLAGSHFAKFKCGTEEVEVNGFVEGTVSLGGKKGPTIRSRSTAPKNRLRRRSIWSERTGRSTCTRNRKRANRSNRPSRASRPRRARRPSPDQGRRDRLPHRKAGSRQLVGSVRVGPREGPTRRGLQSHWRDERTESLQGVRSGEWWAG